MIPRDWKVADIICTLNIEKREVDICIAGCNVSYEYLFDFLIPSAEDVQIYNSII